MVFKRQGVKTKLAGMVSHGSDETANKERSASGTEEWGDECMASAWDESGHVFRVM